MNEKFINKILEFCVHSIGGITVIAVCLFVIMMVIELNTTYVITHYSISGSVKTYDPANYVHRVTNGVTFKYNGKTIKLVGGDIEIVKK